ncbi:MAG TPA: adenosylcobinamide-phosphate synthase CbiB [Candidatus Obscuribacter sp.]|nr:adenosylcobinamide-phosphate synthase CbiB [Candidatus Obscuribacter sp.]
MKIATSPLLVVPALVLDEMLGEPQVLHPLAVFGREAERIEDFFHPLAREANGNLANKSDLNGNLAKRLRTNLAGLLAVSQCVVPPVVLLCRLRKQGRNIPLFCHLLDVIVLYACIAPSSLREHGMCVHEALVNGSLAEARTAVGRIVSRDTASLNEEGVAVAAVESLLENGSDAIFGALFWFALAGAPGALFYRLVNTLDAMWGYRNERYSDFGWAAARLDDLLNFIPARLTAFTYALCGDSEMSLHCLREQGRTWYSPNAGPVMAAGAGALNLSLGGDAVYGGKVKSRPVLGSGPRPCAEDIKRAVKLVKKSLKVWVCLSVLGGVLAIATRRQSR